MARFRNFVWRWSRALITGSAFGLVLGVEGSGAVWLWHHETGHWQFLLWVFAVAWLLIAPIPKWLRELRTARASD
jgi:hypothetical protein